MKRCNLYLRMLFLKYTEYFIRKPRPINSIPRNQLQAPCILLHLSELFLHGILPPDPQKAIHPSVLLFLLLPFYRPLSWYFLYLFLPYFIKIFKLYSIFIYSILQKTPLRLHLITTERSSPIICKQCNYSLF